MPTQQDFQRLIALREARNRGMMGPTQTAALQEIERRMSMGDQVAKVAEPAMTIASSMVAEPLSGLAGIAGTLLPGPQGQGADWVNRTQEALTYMPRTEGGMQSLQGLASLMQPVSDVMQGAEQSMGDFGYENFGPGIGAMMATIPAAASEVAGVGKPVRAARHADDVVDAARTAGRMGRVSGAVSPDSIRALKSDDIGGVGNNILDDVADYMSDDGMSLREAIREAQVDEPAVMDAIRRAYPPRVVPRDAIPREAVRIVLDEADPDEWGGISGVKIDAVVAAPEFRGEGLSRSAVIHKVDEIKKADPSKDIVLLADPMDETLSTTELVEFYRSIGFEPIDDLDTGSGVPMVFEGFPEGISSQLKGMGG